MGWCADGATGAGCGHAAQLQARLDRPLVANRLEMSLAHRAWIEAGVLVNTRESATAGFPLGTVEHCRANGMGVQAWGALARGRFSGAQQTPAERETAECVAALAEQKGPTPETILLRWIQRHPARITPVIGTARPERIRACRDALTRAPELTSGTSCGCALPQPGAPGAAGAVLSIAPFHRHYS